ncbi:exopolysaccharide biosynthesis-like tyrosine-protein kinase [Caballeronia novacaledonica]|uniref:Exopolysaccharide biosynthesis-like tyrosine-protein kinase n=1 Tax=Caballeronia novacaledonica TaxID=1544861 RepID=A0A2U3ICR2_9BURK|nr:polysaccharide biosynthesis tyrosine autokinase [Caballeronia novacaledonica]SPB18014.1 exopolysaccharide biosynthesis-like tyrosine-protein kinase [Caballeronia novacaledonica]
MTTPVLGIDPVPTRTRTDNFSADDFWKLIVDDVWLVIAIALLVTGAATLYAFVATPVYSSDALVKVDYPNPNAFGVNAQAQQQVVPSTLPTDAEMQIIQSRGVLLPVIKKYHQDQSVTPRQVPLIGRISELFATPGQPMAPFLGLKSFAWGGEVANVSTLDVPPRLENKTLVLRVLSQDAYELTDPDGNPILHGAVGRLISADGTSILIDKLVARPGTEFKVVRYSDYQAVARFLKSLKVMESMKDSGVVQIVYENDDPRLAQEITNAIAQTYIAAHVDQHREEASVTRNFIIGELPRLERELQRTESELSDYRKSSNSMQPGTEASSYLQGSIDIERQIATLTMQRAQESSRFVPGSREVRTIDEQLATLNAQKQAFDKRFGQLPVSQRKLMDLTRDAKVAEDVYVAMREKASELAVTRAGTIGNVHLIDSAIYPTDPSKPKRMLIMAGGAAGGVILGILFVFFRDQLSRSVKTPHRVEHRLSLPVFGAVHFSPIQARLDRTSKPSLLPGKNRLPFLTKDASPRVLSDDPEAVSSADRSHALSAFGTRDMAVEALRAVHASLMLDIAPAPNKVLAVVGATPGTGKTFVASNLAVLHAQTGKRTLLIDGDMRRGRIASIFGQHGGIGFSEVLASKVHVDDAIRHLDVPGLSLMTAGRFPANPSKMLSTPRLTLILDYLQAQFDLVIIDTPAVLAVSDANLIAANAGSSVMVVRPGAQSEDELQEAIKRLDLTGARIAGVIFNAVPKRRSERRTYAYASAYMSHSDIDGEHAHRSA